jgi:hypothetical protein
MRIKEIKERNKKAKLFNGLTRSEKDRDYLLSLLKEAADIIKDVKPVEDSNHYKCDCERCNKVEAWLKKYSE